MSDQQAQRQVEEKRLASTLALIDRQLKAAEAQGHLSSASLTHARSELRDEAEHAFIDLNTADDFEALVYLNQFSQSITTNQKLHEMLKEHLDVLRRMARTPYFARIDLKYPDDDEIESLYLGRALLRDEEEYETYIYDWRSPVASVFYRYGVGPAQYDAPAGLIKCDLALKRQFEIKDGTLEYFFDSDVQVEDEYLRQLLSQNASPSMRAIVETIQREQDIAIRDESHDLLMVQGVAGSGKTSIALHRVAYLMYQGLQNHLSAENIVILSPNALFERYIEGVLPELGEKSVSSPTVELLLARLLKELNVESRFQRFERLCEMTPERQQVVRADRAFFTAQDFARVLDRFADHLARHFIDFQDVVYGGRTVFTAEELKERVLRDTPEFPLGVRLSRLERSIYERIHKLRKSRREALEMRAHHVAAFADLVEPVARAYSIHESVALNRHIRRFTRLDIPALYRRLISDEPLIHRLIGHDAPEDLNGMLRRASKSIERNPLPHEHAVAIAYLHLLLEAKGVRTDIRQVVVDEAQDYDPMHYEVLGRLYPKARYTIVGDVGQAIDGAMRPAIFDEITGILKKDSARLIVLNKSFRCTGEILDFGTRFNENAASIERFNRAGEAPRVVASGTQSEMADRVAREIDRCLDAGDESIALIVKTRADALRWHEALKARVNLRLIDENEPMPRGMFVLPVYLAKGLEFDAAILMDADSAHYLTEEDKNLLYVACTRALHRLSVFYAGEISPLLMGEDTGCPRIEAHRTVRLPLMGGKQ